MNQDEKRKLENKLLCMGLKSLEDPELIGQLAQLITNGGMLAGLLNEVDVAHRRQAYEAIRPHLKFKVLRFEWYEDFFARRAEAVESYHNPVVVGDRTEDADIIGAKAILTCCKCNRVDEFEGATPVEVVMQARRKGWVRDKKKNKEICPKCPAVRTKAQRCDGCGSDIMSRCATPHLNK